jgi:hypothetical protein
MIHKFNVMLFTNTCFRDFYSFLNHILFDFFFNSKINLLKTIITVKTFFKFLFKTLSQKTLKILKNKNNSNLNNV